MTKVNEEMFKKSLDAFLKEKKVKQENSLVLFEITLSNLRSTGDIEDSDYLDRAKLLCSMGHMVMISNFSVMASMSVSKKTVSRWGIYKLNKKFNKTDYSIEGVIEKPKIKEAPSNKAVIGRYILPKKIFAKLKNLKPSKGGEIHITDAIQLLINDKEKFIAHNFTGKYLDCGTMDGYINSSKEIAKL